MYSEKNVFPPIKRNVLSVILPDKEAEEDFIYSTLLFMFTLCFALQGRLTPGFDQICSMCNFLNCIIPASSSLRGFLLNWVKSDFTHGWALNPFDFRLKMQFSESSIIYKWRSFSVGVGKKATACVNLAICENSVHFHSVADFQKTHAEVLILIHLNWSSHCFAHIFNYLISLWESLTHVLNMIATVGNKSLSLIRPIRSLLHLPLKQTRHSRSSSTVMQIKPDYYTSRETPWVDFTEMWQWKSWLI